MAGSGGGRSRRMEVGPGDSRFLPALTRNQSVVVAISNTAEFD